VDHLISRCLLYLAWLEILVQTIDIVNHSLLILQEEQFMYTATVTADGQVTIPSEIRQQLGIPSGGPINLEIHQGTLILIPVIENIRAAFGLLKAKKSVSLIDMDKAIEQAILEQYGQS
jgi:AbrB family looped-hinge helix DNA binding protein